MRELVDRFYEGRELVARFGAGQAKSVFRDADIRASDQWGRRQKDSPSGTALRLAGLVSEGSGGTMNPQIASSRAGSEFGLHTLFFDSPDDVIEITHRARGRDAFARGAILAAEAVGQKRGFWSFEELMGWGG